MNLGIDVGSTTIKCTLLKNQEILFKTYKRHNCQVNEALAELLKEIKEQFQEFADKVMDEINKLD